MVTKAEATKFNEGMQYARDRVIAYLERQMKKKITVQTVDNYHLGIARALRYVRTMPMRYNKKKGGAGK